MNALANFADKHPLATKAAGVSGGALSFLMQYLEDLQRVVSFIGTAAGAGVAVLSFLITLRNWRNQRKKNQKP